jgi:MFS family permease
VILVPQPSDDPNDPLNASLSLSLPPKAHLVLTPTQWPQWRKELILFICGLSAAVVGAYGPMLSPGFLEIAENLDITVDLLAQSTSWLLLCLGLGLFITNPLAKLFGRRPIYLAAIVIMFATSVWGAAVKEYSSFLGSRIVAGIGMAPYEILVQCTIGDMYFVHERATRIAVWNLFLLTGISGGALVAGYIIERDGYQWTFWVCAIFFGMLMLAVFFLVPETAYRRKPATPVPSGEKEASGESSVRDVKLGHETTITSSGDDNERSAASEFPAVPKKHTYVQSLRVFTGRYSHAPGWKPFARPAVMLFYPAVMWGFLVYGKHSSELLSLAFRS